MRTAVLGYRKQCAFLGLLVVSLSGCSSLFNPYVRTDAAAHPYHTGNVSLPDAMRYANEVRSRYKDALTNQGRLSTGLGAALIPLTGIIGYQGISGVNGHAIAATSLGGAAILGTGTYLHSVPRQKVYAEASAAITCAINLAAPLQLSESESNRLNKAVDQTLPRALAILTPPPAGSLSRVSTKIRKVLDAGLKVRSRLNQAGYQLVATVDSIMDKADLQIMGTIPDPRALAFEMGGLLPLPKVTANDLLGKEELQNINVYMQKHSQQQRNARMSGGTGQPELDAEKLVTSILNSMEFVVGLVERLSSLTDIANVAGCSEHMVMTGTGIQLHPAPESNVISLPLGKESEYQASITGGKLIGPTGYSVLLATKPAEGKLSAEVISEAGGYTLRVTADSKVPAGKYPLVIRDSGSVNLKELAVEVK